MTMMVVASLRAQALLFTALLIPVFAGPQRRSVSGFVVDHSGKPIAGAAVKLKNVVTLDVRSYITQEDGHYRFYGLHPDMEYSLRARRDGHSSKSRRITKFESRESIRLDLQLPYTRR